MAQEKKPSLFGRIRNWFKEQITQFNLQRACGTRDNLSIKEMKVHDAGVKNAVDNAYGFYDQAIAVYEYRKTEELDPSRNKQAIGAANGDVTMYMRQLSDLSEKSAARFGKEPGGWGIGAALGRLMSGRRSQEAVANGNAAFQRVVTETGFSKDDAKELATIKVNREAIGNLEITADIIVAKIKEDRALSAQQELEEVKGKDAVDKKGRIIPKYQDIKMNKPTDQQVLDERVTEAKRRAYAENKGKIDPDAYDPRKVYAGAGKLKTVSSESMAFEGTEAKTPAGSEASSQNEKTNATELAKEEFHDKPEPRMTEPVPDTSEIKAPTLEPGGM